MMNTWKVVCATLVIFIAGIVTGATLVRVAQGGRARWIQRPPVENRGQPNPGNPTSPNLPNDPRAPKAPNAATGLLSREFIQILERQLQLTAEQREQIGRIMTEGQERVRELRTRIDPELRKELQQTREQIRSVLTPEQRQQFEQLMKRPPRRNERGDSSAQPDRRSRDQREPRNPPPVGEPDSQSSPPPPDP